MFKSNEIHQKLTLRTAVNKSHLLKCLRQIAPQLINSPPVFKRFIHVTLAIPVEKLKTLKRTTIEV